MHPISVNNQLDCIGKVYSRKLTVSNIHRFLFEHNLRKRKQSFFLELFREQMPDNDWQNKSGISDGLSHDFVIIITTTNGRR